MANPRLDERRSETKEESVDHAGARAFLLSPFFFLATWRRWSAPLGLLCAAFVLQVLAGLSPHTTELYYSRSLYPRIGRSLAFVNKFFSFSVAELLVLAFLVGCVIGAVWLIREIILRRVEWKTFLWKSTRNLLWLAASVAVLFLLLWGLNYERQSLFENLQLERRQASADELEIICRQLINGINQNYDDAHASLVPNIAMPNTATANTAAAHTQLPLSRAQLYAVIGAAYQQTALPGVTNDSERFGPPKPIRFSRALTRLGISGMFSPFTGEANFNAEQPDCNLPFAMAHEMAHQRGFAREDEANFIAFLICANSAHPYVRYSGYLNSLNVLGTLARVAPERLASVYGTLNAGPRADLLARYMFWTNYQGRLSATSHLINNAYLKANRIKSGAKNYNEVSALIIGYYLKKNFIIRN